MSYKKIQAAIRNEKINRGFHWKLQNWIERANHGYSQEDLWGFNTHLARIIADGSRQIVYSTPEEEGEITRMSELFGKYARLRVVSDDEYKEMFKLLKKHFHAMWF